MTRFIRHYLLSLQFFTRIPVSGRLAQWVGYSPAMLRASAGHFPGVGVLVGYAQLTAYLIAIDRNPMALLQSLVPALIASGLAFLVMWRWFWRRLRGFTGDCLGTTQQLCELAFYLGLALTL
jgi:adenosylcobinamide-GDP ribazoletransferase